MDTAITVIKINSSRRTQPITSCQNVSSVHQEQLEAMGLNVFLVQEVRSGMIRGLVECARKITFVLLEPSLNSHCHLITMPGKEEQARLYRRSLALRVK